MRPAWLLAVCACSEPRLLLEVDTPDGPMTATTLEIILAEPTTSARRDQRTNSDRASMTSEPETETVHYFAQRTRIDFSFDGETAIDGFELQLVAQEVEAYVPIIVARDANGAIVGLGGVVDPFNETTLRRVDYLYDVTRYTVEVEPAKPPVNSTPASNRPVVIQEGNVLVVPCDQMGTSGYAWRPQSRVDLVRPQLRILLPFDRPDGDALPRLFDGPDLDCDQHTPQQRGEPGDELDCDDTTPIVFGGPPPEHEVCDFVDNDCNNDTKGATVRGDMCTASLCSRKAITCTEDGGPFPGTLCPDALAGCPVCSLVTEVQGTEMFGCEHVMKWTIPAECGSTCVVRLVDIDARWDVRIGDIGSPDRGLFESYHPIGNALEIAISPRDDSFSPTVPEGGSFVIMMRASSASDPLMFDMLINLPEDKQLTACPVTPVQTICQ